jgi:hypothetical protein
MMYLDEYIFRCIAKSMNLEVPKRPTIWEGGRQGVHVIIETESLKMYNHCKCWNPSLDCFLALFWASCVTFYFVPMLTEFRLMRPFPKGKADSANFAVKIQYCMYFQKRTYWYLLFHQVHNQR